MKFLFPLVLISTFVFPQDDTTIIPTNTYIPKAIFPLIAGRMFHYTGHLTQQDTETPVSGTDAEGVYSASVEIGSTTPLYTVFGPAAEKISVSTAVLLADSAKISTLNPNMTYTPRFMYQDTLSADYYMLTNLGLFFRSAHIKDSLNASGVRADSLKFIKLASPAAGIGREFISFDQNFISFANPSAPMTIQLRYVGKWAKKETLSVHGQQFIAYNLITSRTASISGILISSGIVMRMWFADSIGPVRMFLAGDAESNGHYRELISTNSITGVSHRRSDFSPTAFALHQNYPNPFNPETTIEYDLAQNGIVSLTLYDILGKEIKVLENGFRTKGKQIKRFNVSHLPGGVYFYILKADKFRQARKMMLLK